MQARSQKFFQYTQYIDTLAEQSLITTYSDQTRSPNSYKYGYTFLESSGQPHQMVSQPYNRV